MPRRLHALFLALLPLSAVPAAEPSLPHSLPSLAVHEHGSAQLNLALDGRSLELELASPAMNLVGFEHPPREANDRALVAAARAALEQPGALFGIPAAASCRVDHLELDGEAFEAPPAGSEASGHSEILALYRLDCTNPAELKTLDLAKLFEAFPDTLNLRVQLVGPNGQRGEVLEPQQPHLKL